MPLIFGGLEGSRFPHRLHASYTSALLNWSDSASRRWGAAMSDLWLGGGDRDGKERVRKLTAEADADRVAAQIGYQPLPSRFLRRLRRFCSAIARRGGMAMEKLKATIRQWRQRRQDRRRN